MDIRSDKDFKLGFQKFFFLSETGKETSIVYHSMDTKNTLAIKKYHQVEAKIWGKFVTCL